MPANAARASRAGLRADASPASPNAPVPRQLASSSALVDAFRLPTDKDDTLSIQRALTAAGKSGHVVFQCRQYNVSETLHASYNQTIEGCGPNNTIIQRMGDYGDTLDIGSPTEPSFAFTVKGIWFRQFPYDYGAPRTSLANLATRGAHVHFWGAQGYTIKDCWISRLPYGILAEGGTIGLIEHNNIIGYWDPQHKDAQEGVAGIYLRHNGNPTSVYISHNNLTGIGYPDRHVTLTSSDPKTVTPTIGQPVGPKYLILAEGCEDCEVDAGYVGGAAVDNIHLDQVEGAYLLDIRIHDVHFDSAGRNDIYVSSAKTPGRGLSIHSNIFNAENATLHAIDIEASQNAAPTPSMTDVTISDNVAFAYAASPFLFGGAQYVTISGNTISSYNVFEASTGKDPAYSSAISLFGLSKSFTIAGNTLCGNGGNTIFGLFDTTPKVGGVSTNTFGLNGNGGCKAALRN